MKTLLAFLILAGTFSMLPWDAAAAQNQVVVAGGQPAAPPPEQDAPTIVERGAHHRVWQRVRPYVTAAGKTYYRTNSYTELATGLHFRQPDGSWADAREVIVPVAGGGLAQEGQTKLFFSANLNTAGAIQMTAPDGAVFKSHVLCLAYTDARTGESVLIARVKDSIGQLIAPNQVLYPDAFDSVQADVRYTYMKSGFEQDIVLRQNDLPPPEDWGLDSATVRLEIVSEFIQWTVPTIRTNVISAQANPVLRQQMVEPDLTDQTLDFGSFTIPPGSALPLSDTPVDSFDEGTVPMGKIWSNLGGRQFLIEKVDFKAIKKQLEQLPQAAAVAPLPPAGQRAGVQGPTSLYTSRQSLLAGLQAPSGKAAQLADKKMQTAALAPVRPGLVLDYSTLNSSLTNYVFRGDSTYYISASINLYGTTTIEGGATVKFASNAISCSLYGPVVCQTSLAHPAFFTAKDDNTVGETISGSTGAPGGIYAGYTFALHDTTTTYDFHDLRIRYASYGFAVFANMKASIRHTQFGSGIKAVAWQGGVSLTNQNILVYDHTYVFYCAGVSTNRTEHLTAHRVGSLLDRTNHIAGPTCLTNSLLISVTNNLIYQGGSDVVTNLSDTGFFQTVGAGARYLAAGSTYRNAGTPNINAVLRADLRQRTTHPPIVLSNNVTAYTDLSPQAPRETNSFPDIGFAYDPLDYVVHEVSVLKNATLVINPGTALGTYGAWDEAGLRLYSGSQLVCEGTATNLNRIVRYNMVQEQASTNWTSTSGVGYSVATYDYLVTNYVATPIRFRFTQWSSPAAFVSVASNLTITLQDCQFHAGVVTFYYPTIAMTNCLLERTSLYVSSYQNPDTFTMRNCTFFSGEVHYSDCDKITYDIKDNLFDATVLNQDTNFVSDFNAYVTNCNRFSPTGSHDVILSVAPAYQTGPLGRFYLPTNAPCSLLTDAGSVSDSASIGLFHFTSWTNNLKEANSTNNIGFHYIACSNGVPCDTDGDGIPDWVEDVDGNGTQGGDFFNTPVESDWQRKDADLDYDGIYDHASNNGSLMRLGYWQFNTDSFLGSLGEATVQKDATTNASWSATAAHYSNGGSRLFYRETELPTIKSNANINCRNGTVRFWFKPNWSSTNVPGGGGLGAHWAYFVELGAGWPNSMDWWVLRASPEGTYLEFITRSNGMEVTAIEAPCSFRSNCWSQIALTYSPTNVALYLNGQMMTNNIWSKQWDRPHDVFGSGLALNHVGAGIFNYPPAQVRVRGLHLGTDAFLAQQINGDLEELETFNYPLTAREIARAFPNFNGATNLTADADYDGRSDLLQEQVDGADKSSGTNAASCRLGYWRFNGDTSNLIGEQGQIPLLVSDISVVAGWSSNALTIGTGSTSALIYRDVETNGWANINCRFGSLCFWFKPAWNAGSGPLNGSFFLYLGDQALSASRWSLGVNSVGQLITFVTGTNSTTTNHFQVNCPFVAGKWYHLALNYGPSNLELYTNGVLAHSQATGIVSFPGASDRANGVAIGNDVALTRPINGQFDELETFNYQLTAGEIARKFETVRVVDNNLNGVPDILEDIVLTNSTPFLGFPIVVTGTIEAEQFDKGGPGIAYTNQGGNTLTNDYRASQVQTTTNDDMGGGYCVSNLRSNEWLNYTIEVRVAQTYAVEARVAPIGTNVGGVFRIDFYTNGVCHTNSGPLTITSNNWANATARMLYLPAGTNVMRLVMTNNAPGTNVVGRFNYLSVYADWLDGVTNITQTNDVTGLMTGYSWQAATNNAVRIQLAIDSLAAGSAGCVTITNGTYFVAQIAPDEMEDTHSNTCVFVSRSNLELRGAGKTNTVLAAFTRSTTILYVGKNATLPHSDAAVTNFALSGITLEGRPHLALINSTNTTYEQGILYPANRNTGTLLILKGDNTGPKYIVNVLITNCLFRNPSLNAIAATCCVSNVLVRGCDFVFRDGSNGTFPLPRTVTTPSVTTSNFFVVNVGFWVRPPEAVNINVRNCTLNGNPAMISLDINYTADLPDGLVYFQSGGNWFVSDNIITNNGLEAVAFYAGPAAATRNEIRTFGNTGSTTALSAFGSAFPTATGTPGDASLSISFVGNVVEGGRSGEIGLNASGNNVGYRLHFCGNQLTLQPALNRVDDYPGSAIAGRFMEFLNASGNTMLAGDQGVMLGDHSTNAFILKNNFAAASTRGIFYLGTNGHVRNLTVARNIISQGVSYHLRLRPEEAFDYFLIQNHYRMPGSTNGISPFIDAAGSPVHFFH